MQQHPDKLVGMPHNPARKASALQVRCVGMQERVSLRDCQVGPGFTVSEGAEHREEVLAKAQQQRKSSDTKN